MKYSTLTNQEKLQKAYRYGLEPTTLTARTIKSKNLIEENRKVLALADEFKPAYDAFIKKVVAKALPEVKLDFTKYMTLYTSGDKKAYDAFKKKCQGDISEVIDKALPIGRAKINSSEFITKILPEYIRETTGEKADELIELSKSAGMGELLSSFAITRVSSLDKAAVRYLDNLEKYLDNCEKLDKFIQSEYSAEFLGNFKEAEDFIWADYYPAAAAQQGIDFYNTMISGRYDENGNCIAVGYNQMVNEINQKNKSDGVKVRFRKLDMLYKQVLVPQEKKFQIDSISSDKEVRETLLRLNEFLTTQLLFDIYKLVKDTDASEISISGEKIRYISHLITGDYNEIYSSVLDRFIAEKEAYIATVKGTEKKKAKGELNRANTIVNGSVYTLKEVCDISGTDVKTQYCAVLKSKYSDVVAKRSALDESGLLVKDYKIKNNFKHVDLIKSYLDAMNDFKRTLSYILVKEYSDECVEFYAKLVALTENINMAAKATNLIRNYITKKLGDTCVIEGMTFGMPAMTGNKWWTGDKLSKGENLLFVEDNEYYIAIPLYDMPASQIVSDNESDVKGLAFKNKTDSSKNLPRMAFNKATKDAFKAGAEEFIREDAKTAPLCITKEIWDIYVGKTAYKDSVNKGIVSEEERIENAVKLVQYYKDFMKANAEWNIYPINRLKEASEYESVNDFTTDLDALTVSMNKIDIDKAVITKLEESGQLLVFRIYSKKLYKKRKNLDTNAQMLNYFFSDKNLNENTTVRITGAPKIQYSPASVERRVTHAKGSTLVNRYDSNKQRIPEETYLEINQYYDGTYKLEELSADAKNYVESGTAVTHEAAFDIVKDARYTRDRYFIVLGMAKNIQGSTRPSAIKLNEQFDAHVIDGANKLVVTRNKTDLIYYTVFDKLGNVIAEESLNVINGFDYAGALKAADGQRKSEKSDSWEYGATVKELRTAYIELAIAKISRTADEYNAVIIVEKINEAKKRKAMSFDDNALVLFEEKLCNKMADYADRNKDFEEAGSVANPYQLALSSGKDYSHNGIIYKVITNYTDTMCPITGYVNLFNFRNIDRVEDKREFLSRFESIYFDEAAENLYFRFNYLDFDLKNDSGKNKSIGKPDWTLKAGGRRAHKNEYGEYEVINDCLAALKAILHGEGEECRGEIIIENLSNKALNEVFRLFRQTSLYLTFRYKNDYAFISPVLGEIEGINPTQAVALNVHKKFMYDLETRDAKTSDYTGDWLKYAQK